ncbi:MAG: 4-hydroxybenzoyl-CoA thioesterase [Parasphingorhabdus sp.]|jgi:4-hydroxybenzoyl-CoA thioesterase
MLNQDYQKWHSTYKLIIQWGDCDPADIVYYPNYYRWMDNATHHLFANKGYSFGEMREQFGSLGFPLIKADATFLAPSRVGDELTIYSRLESGGRKSLKIEHHFCRENLLVVTGAEKRIMGAKRPKDGSLFAMLIPDEIVQAFSVQD